MQDDRAQRGITRDHAVPGTRITRSFIPFRKFEFKHSPFRCVTGSYDAFFSSECCLSVFAAQSYLVQTTTEKERSMQSLRLLAIGITLAMGAACQGAAESTGQNVCPADLRASMDKPTVTLRTADSTRLLATALGCGGTVVLATSWEWSAQDSSILRVDASSGWVFAVRPGISNIVATSQPPYSVSVTSIVTVLP